MDKSSLSSDPKRSEAVQSKAPENEIPTKELLHDMLNITNLPSEPVTIFFIRHGETDYNVERRMQGSIDTPLNERGVNQARDVLKQLKAADISFDGMFSSDLQRAALTASIIADGTPVTKLKELRERSMGKVEGMIYDDAHKFARSEGHNDLLAYGESEQAITTRLDSAWKQILATAAESKMSRIGVVSHGGALAMLFRHLVKTRTVSPHLISKKFGSRLTNCCVTVVHQDEFRCYGVQLTSAVVHVDKDLL